MADASEDKRARNMQERARIEEDVRAEILTDTAALLAETRQLRKRLAELRQEVAVATEEAQRLRARR
jgi:hypothetical protein